MSKDKTETVKIRRAPKFIPFMFTGFLLGGVVSIVLSLLITTQEGKTAGFITQILVYCLGLGAGVGLVAAVIFDALTARRLKDVQVSKSTSS
jgi:ABC-type antimicrobial peptide transport system permease subunit